jgi:hypothetical protein
MRGRKLIAGRKLPGAGRAGGYLDACPIFLEQLVPFYFDLA